MDSSSDNVAGLLQHILAEITTLKQENSALASQIDSINGKVTVLSSVKQIKEGAEPRKSVVLFHFLPRLGKLYYLLTSYISNI